MDESDAWAACPQVEYISSLDVPKVFTTEDQARKFIKSFPPWPRARIQQRKQAIADVKAGKIARLPFQLARKRRSESGWRCLPIKPIETGSSTSPIPTFRDFIPPEQIGQVPEDTLEDVVLRAYENRFPSPLCFLAEEWKFEDILDHAKRLPGHEFAGRLHRDVTDIAVKALYDFDASLRFLRPELAPISIADFYTSWQLWRHIAELCVRIGDSAVAKKLAGDPGSARKQANAVQSFLYIQLSSFAHQLTSIPTVVVRSREGQRTNISSAGDNEPITSDLLQAFLTAIDEQDAILTEAHGNDSVRLIPQSQWSVIKGVFDRIGVRVQNFSTLDPDRSQDVVRAHLRSARAEIMYMIRKLEMTSATPITAKNASDAGDIANSEEPRASGKNDTRPKFPRRAAWLQKCLMERGWDKNSLYPMGGPDRKTVQKILDGRYVRAEVLPRLVAALNHRKIKGVTAELNDIPSN